MPIFKISGTNLKRLNSLLFTKEKGLQAMDETTLSEVRDLPLATESGCMTMHSEVVT